MQPGQQIICTNAGNNETHFQCISQYPNTPAPCRGQKPQCGQQLLHAFGLHHVPRVPGCAWCRAVVVTPACGNTRGNCTSAFYFIPSSGSTASQQSPHCLAAYRNGERCDTSHHTHVAATPHYSSSLQWLKCATVACPGAINGSLTPPHILSTLFA
ncbi:unnamed protein product [Trypanosoma congolense IL3000]|uniref:WGS project CAEQ00000000 data, annotated contig 1324 n=1 Tax=Trypanosoma congolense (strain IL3000) TaxID=1068625 RepID=F9W5H2_TRYCI|nr:unnamed protein product [Trypanosoma congolense IL3000]